jgi:hypothetical protein
MAPHFELREELARERRLVSKKWPSLPIYIAGKITSGDGDDRNRICSIISGVSCFPESARLYVIIN